MLFLFIIMFITSDQWYTNFAAGVGHKVSCDALVLGLERSQKLASGETGVPEAPDPTWHCFQVCILLLEREQDAKVGLSAGFQSLPLTPAEPWSHRFRCPQASSPQV